jgi:hypothetical protein
MLANDPATFDAAAEQMEQAEQRDACARRDDARSQDR